MRFSERIGKNQPKVEIQLDFMDQELKNSLWNVVCMFITEPMVKQQYLYESPFKSFVESIWFSFFKEPIDQIPFITDRVSSELRNRFFSWNYLDTYDFIDFVASRKTPFNNEKFITACNFILKRELSGYRFVNGQLAPITNEQEIGEIEKAITAASDKSLVGVKTHLSEALNKLSDKKSPDYRNSIKESILAVESICQVITGDSKAELGKALKTLSSKLPIHGALLQGFIKIYGYTSDGDGIRHAMMDESSLDQEDALYMLISCSSFINYLMTKSNKMGIEVKKEQP
jgi:hypothetical protein